MTDLPKLAILLLTYKRTDMAIRTIQSTVENLKYPKELIGWYVADDGSHAEHFSAVMEELEIGMDAKIIGYHSQRIRTAGQENTHHAGPGWNKGLGICHQYSDYVLVLEDDWELDEPLDLEHYIRVMEETEIGLMSFRILSVGADVHTVGHRGEIFLRYDKTTQCAYSGNPHVRHARFTKAYGWYVDDKNPGEIELKMDDSYRLATEGPEIWRPVGINQWGSWKHIGSEPTWRE
jgi:hypothetical protein